MPQSEELIVAAIRGRQRRHGLIVAALVGVLTASFPGSAPAAETAGAGPLASVVLDSSALGFEPAVEVPGWILTVAGPSGFYQRQEFRGRSPRLELVGADGSPLADGAYSWELWALSRSPDGWRPSAAQWGDFHVLQGAAVLPDETVERPTGPAEAPAGEGTASRAPTHGDDVDVYIDGHLCVGGGAMESHCTGGETLALRTILMKEDNVRLRFEDTSDEVTNFPSTDWQLSANGASSGSADYFAIEDLGDTGVSPTKPFRVDAGAGNHAIRVNGSGHVGLGISTPGARLHVNGDAIVEGDFSAASSREIKQDFAPVESRAILERLVELPVTEWSYRSGGPGVRHLGPVAEEFHAAFALGRDPRHLSPLDLSGVAFAAIQGLHEVVLERQAEIEELRRSRDELTTRLEALERLIGPGAR